MKTTNNLFYLIVIIISSYIVLLGVFSSLEYNVNTPNHTVKLLFNLSAPEGWGFFTRSPREDIVDIYSIKNHSLKKLSIKNGHYSNGFGVSRKSRKIGMETSIILGKLKDSMWLEKNDISNLDIPKEKYSIDNKNLHYLKKGNYLLVKKKIVPWAWRKNINIKDIPYEITHIKIESEDQLSISHF